MTLKAQRIRYASQGGSTGMTRTVRNVRLGRHTDYGTIQWLGGTYVVSRAPELCSRSGSTDLAYWRVEDRLVLYPAGHPLESLNAERLRKAGLA